mmetsp:Transcript_14645/g.51462  ORF Transcript_14645/g.51462 Transcript_14645/m.51462 type:complete len:124 (+) Transcript_14645:794-1165(+)
MHIGRRARPPLWWCSSRCGAMALFEAGDDAEAMRQLMGLVWKNPGYGEANNALAAVAASSGERSVAEDAMSRARRYDENEGFATRRPRDYADSLGWTPRLARAFETFCSEGQTMAAVPQDSRT